MDKYSVFDVRCGLSTTCIEYHHLNSEGRLVGTWETVTSNKKGEETFGFSPLFAFYGLVLTFDLPYPQTGEHPQYANSGNQGY